MVGGEFTTSAECAASSDESGAVTSAGEVESSERYTSTVPILKILNPRRALDAIFL